MGLLPDDPWKRALWIGLTVFWIGLLFYVRIVKPLFMLRRPYRVTEVRKGARRHLDVGDAARTATPASASSPASSAG